MNFCSKCGSGDLNLMVPTGDNRPRHVCDQCSTIHYLNPKIITGCLPIWNEKVLLCRRAIEPRRGYWNVPAGFMEVGETAEEGAEREVWEEAEAKVKIWKLHTVFTFKKYAHVYVQFLGELMEGKFGVGEESIETKLFSENEIPWSDIAFESSVFALKMFFEDRKKGHFQSHYGAL